MNKYRADIDGLRAIAVICVLFFHLKITAFSGGFLGVDVFFVISGYLITGLLFVEIQSNQTISFTSFYARRFKRLLPALLVFLILTLIVWCIYFFSLDSQTTKFLTSMKYGLFGFANNFFKNNIGNYFDTTSDKMPLLHLWSLGVEEQFYFIWPLIFFIVFKLNNKNFHKNILITIFAITVVSFLSSLWHIYTGHQIRAFYSMHLRMWEIGIGAIGAILKYRNEGTQPSAKVSNLLSTLGGFLILGSIFLFKENEFFPGWRSLIVCVGTYLLIFFNLENSFCYKVLKNRFLVFIGLISYSLYLYHWPVISFLNIYNLKNEMSNLQKVYIFIGVIIFSIGSYYLIENNMKKSNAIKKVSNRSVVFIGLALLVSFTFFINIIQKNHQNKISSSLFYQYINERVVISEECRGTIRDFDFTNCFLLPKESEISLRERDLIFIWGDSYAYATGNLLDSLVKKNKSVQVVMLANYSRPPLIDLDILWDGNENWTTENNKINNVVLEQIKKMVKVSKSVSIAFEVRWPRYSKSLDKNKTYEGSALELEKKLEKTISILNNIGVKKYLITLPYPEYEYDISECTRLRNDKLCYIDENIFKNKYKATTQALVNISRRFNNVKLLNPLEVVCTDGKCNSIIKDNEVGDYPASWDDCHPTSIATKKLADHFQGEIDWLLLTLEKK